MFNSKSLLNNLPPAPTYAGKWASIYLEPMMGSGELITVAVAAIGSDGAFKVRPAIRDDVVEAMFGTSSDRFSKLVQLTCKSLERHLESSRTFAGWRPPAFGLNIGQCRDSISFDLTGLLRQAVMLTASLAALDFDQVEEELPDSAGDGRDQWTKLFEDAVVSEKPELAENFNYKFRVAEKARPSKIFYLDQKIALNAGKIHPGSGLSGLFIKNKASLMDLLALRERDQSHMDRDKYELVLLSPELDDPIYSPKQLDALRDSICTLEEYSSSHALKLVTVHSVEEAATHLIGQAA